MHKYVDIKIRPDPEFPPNFLMNKIYTRLHRWLAQTKTHSIAVSFPGYEAAPATLGRILRLIGPTSELTRLMEHDWLQGMHDYADTKPLAVVPQDAIQRALRRVQTKSSPERLRRRQIRRHGLTPEQALERVPDGNAKTLNLPFLTLPSASTGQQFRLFLRLSPPGTSTQTGHFNSYGLSSIATIPWF